MNPFNVKFKKGCQKDSSTKLFSKGEEVDINNRTVYWQEKKREEKGHKGNQFLSLWRTQLCKILEAPPKFQFSKSTACWAVRKFSSKIPFQPSMDDTSFSETRKRRKQNERGRKPSWCRNPKRYCWTPRVLYATKTSNYGQSYKWVLICFHTFWRGTGPSLRSSTLLTTNYSFSQSQWSLRSALWPTRWTILLLLRLLLLKQIPLHEEYKWSRRQPNSHSEGYWPDYNIKGQ